MVAGESEPPQSEKVLPAGIEGMERSATTKGAASSPLSLYGWVEPQATPALEPSLTGALWVWGFSAGATPVG